MPLTTPTGSTFRWSTMEQPETSPQATRSSPPLCQRHCKHIVTAYQNYTEIYTNMAVLGTESASDLEASSRAFILALNGEHVEANPYGTAFMEKTYTTTNAPGSFPDAWQNQYLVRLDDDGDGYIQMGERKVKGSVIAWSCGLDGKNDWAKKDDIFYKE